MTEYYGNGVQLNPAPVVMQPADGQADVKMEQMIVDMSGVSTAAEEKEDLSKYQMIAAGFFAQTREPALTINENKVCVNATAVRLFPDVDYMEILINTEEQKVAFKPCDELRMSSYKWAKTKDGKRYATQRTGLPFVLCVCKVMGWDPNKRWRILGKKLRSQTNDEILIFDLKAGQGFDKPDAGKEGRKSRSTILTGWDGTFGPTYGENHDSLQIGMFDKYTYFSIKNGEVQKAEQPQEKASEVQPDSATEEKQAEQSVSINENQGEQVDGAAGIEYDLQLSSTVEEDHETNMAEEAL